MDARELSADPEVAQLARRVADLESELAASRGQLETLIDGMGEAFYALDRDWRFTVFNPGAERYFGRPKAEMLGRRIWDLFPWTAGSELRRRMEELMETREAAHFEADSVAVPGRRVEFHMFPFGDGLALSFRDWTVRRQAEETIRENEERYRLATEAYQGGVSDHDYVTGEVARSARFLAIVGEERGGIGPDPADWIGRIHPEDLDAFSAADEALSEGDAAHFEAEYRVRHRDGHYVWVWHRALAMRAPDGRLLRVISSLVDITERKEAEEHLQLLVNELNHRVKNTLATVQSIAAQSLRDADPAQRRAFEARLFALSHAHDVLTRENWQGALLGEIVRGAIAPYAGDGHRRFAVTGPPLRLAPRAALSLAMGLHELCTNAAKYGALSQEGGRVVIGWEVAGELFRLRWTEEGGPPVAAPERRGFGTRLIERGLAHELDATVRLDFAPSGLTATVEAPLAQVREG